MNLGKVIKQEIKNQGFKQKEIAELVGISTNAISQICIGSAIPNKTTLSKICKVLNIEIIVSIKNLKT